MGERADMMKELNDEKNTTEVLRTIMEIAHDGFVVVDQDGVITMISKDYAKFIGVSEEEAVGKHVTEVIENTRMHIVAQTGKPEIADIQLIKGDYMIATRMPLLKEGIIVGAVGKVLFRNLSGLNALHRRIRRMEKDLELYKGALKEQNKATYDFESLIGDSPAFSSAVSLAQRSAQADSNVLLLGESGTGKELFAHAIHNASNRRFGSFVKVNCAAIPSDLLESELFGYVEGSFTGAKKGGKKGKFEAADGGTIFLDEIGELPLHMQVKFLRVLQEKEVEKIGATGSKSIDVRVIAATNQNLEEMVDKGEFRLDLFYRLNVLAIPIPPLRERNGDLVTLTNYILQKLCRQMGKQVAGITDSAMHALSEYSWPGNVRELQNVLERAVNMVDDGERIDSNHLPEKVTGTCLVKEVRSLKQTLEDAEKKALLDALAVNNGNKSKAAKLLEVSRSTFYEKLKKHHLIED
ncbi:sigma 54-interacting transcriptional regulator [Bacillus tianshenii]|nr:sigma 54-interacting transcriptional regulator [Bacillus tianshenii]